MPHDGFGLVTLVLLLGVKHGMDPDHLATIDGLARFNLPARPRLSRWSGFLFSLGHGAVVTLVAALVAGMATGWSPPGWLERAGAWISIAFLLVLGWANLAAVLKAPIAAVVRPVGLKGRWLAWVTQTSHPVLIATIGAAFALSFDTLSQAALFSITASGVAGAMFAASLGVIFMIGMMLTDGANGLWVSRMLSRADRRARVASRVLGLSIGLLSVSIAALGFAREFSPAVVELTEGAGLLMGGGVAAVVLASYALALRLSRPA